MSLPAVTFRPFTPADLPLLAHWLARPHVARWWREDPDPAAVDARYRPCLDGRDPTELFVLAADGQPAGFFQRYLVASDPDWAAALRATGEPGTDNAAGIDYLIGEERLTGHGLGSRAIAAFTTQVLDRYPEADMVAVTVAQDNVASWRALEKAGYRRRWSGELASDDPSDEGPEYLYRRDRDNPPPAG